MALFPARGITPIKKATLNSVRSSTVPVPAQLITVRIHHPALELNRRSIRVRKAFALLRHRDDIGISVDRGGYNPQETPRKFPEPNLHWDVNGARPVPFGMQGILYLTDMTSAEPARGADPRSRTWNR